MNLTSYVLALQHHLELAAQAGGPDSLQVAERLTAPLESATRLVLLEALSDAAAEISQELAPGSVDVRLRSGEPEFVVVPAATPAFEELPEELPAEEPQAAMPDPEGGSTTRTTVRLPDHLKTQVDLAASREGISVNTWLVRAVSTGLNPAPPAPTRRARGAGDRYTGWVS